jgi:glycosyltransferase involved in cell wall biosynthesis
MPRSLTLLVSSTQRRGAEVFCELLTDALANEQWKTELVALTQTPGPAVRAHPLSLGRRLGKLSPRTVLDLRRHLKRARPAVLLAFGSSTLKYAVAANAFLPHRPRLAYASIGEPLYWARSQRQKSGYRALLRRVDLVLSVSERTSVQLRQALGVPYEKLRVTPTGVPSSLLDTPQPGPHAEFRMLFVGNLSGEKDPLATLAAFAQVAGTREARLRILGSGPLEGALRTRVDELGLREQVEMTGSVEAVEPHLAWADVLIITSQTEGLPAVALEAAAAAKPVVAYDVGGVSEAIIDRATGRLVGSGDVDGLVAALLEYAANPEQAQAAGEAGRRLVAKRFTIEASARGFDDALSVLAPRHEGAP